MPVIDDSQRKNAAGNDRKALAASLPNKIRPIVIMAAVGGTIFSAIGIGIMTGIVPCIRALNATEISKQTTPGGMPPSPMAAGAAMVPMGSADDAGLPESPKSFPPSAPADKAAVGRPPTKDEFASHKNRVAHGNKLPPTNFQPAVAQPAPGDKLNRDK